MTAGEDGTIMFVPGIEDILLQKRKLYPSRYRRSNRLRYGIKRPRVCPPGGIILNVLCYVRS